jgi:hypothetical protein
MLGIIIRDILIGLLALDTCFRPIDTSEALETSGISGDL